MLTATFLAALIVVASSDGAHVTLIDDRTLTAAGTIEVGKNPHELTLSSDHRIAWVANTSGSVTQLDLQHRRAMRTIPLVDCKVPHDLRASRDHQTLWVTCAQENAILELDTLTRTTRARHDVKAAGAWMIAASHDDSLLATANLEGGSISLLDEKRDARVVTTSPGEIALDIAPDGTVWTGNSKTGHVVLFTRDGTRINGVPGIRSPIRIKVTPDGRRAVINDGGRKALAVVDTQSLEIVKSVALPATAKVLALSPDGKKAAATAPGSNQLFIVDLESGKLLKSIPVAGNPDGVVWAAVPSAPPTKVTAASCSRS